MTLDELESACTEAEKDCAEWGIKSALQLMIPGNRCGRTCRIAPGLSGENMGHYGDQTMVLVETQKIRKFIQKARQELQQTTK